MKPSRLSLILGLSLLAALLCLASAVRAQDRTIIIADRAVAADGTLVPTGAIVISGGKIERLATSADAAQLKEAQQVYRGGSGAVLCPGLIDLRSSLGAFNNNVDRTHPIDPALSVLEAIDPADPALATALAAGITAALITPADNKVVAGTAATVRTFAPDGRLDVLRADGPLVLCLGPSVFNTDREPTSRPGALFLLREALTQAKAGKGDTRLADLLAGKQSAIAVCAAGEDVTAMIRTLAEYHVVPAIVHTPDLVDTVADIKSAGAAVIAGPYSFSSSPRSLAGPAAAAAAGLDLAFAAGTPANEAASLRVCAALAVRYGMDAAAARRAMTSTAARIARVDDRVGAVKPGLDADLVLFSGDPLRLDSRVLEVYIKGQRVYAAPPPPASADAAASTGDSHDRHADKP